jgi:hypothetical protein
MQEGIAGFGERLEDALRNFNEECAKAEKVKPKKARIAKKRKS